MVASGTVRVAVIGAAGIGPMAVGSCWESSPVGYVWTCE
jgi:hypothetical protein